MQDKVLMLLISVMVFTAEIAFLSSKNHQPAVIITTHGDTIACLIKGFPGQSIDYKTQNDSIYQKIDIKAVKEYQLTKRHAVYRPLVMPGGITPVFMLLLDTGKINLFAYYERVGKTSYTHLFALIENKPAIKVFGYNANLDNKDSLSQLIAGNQQALAYLNAQTDYTYAVVVKTIKLYNGSIQPDE